ncbi:MAG: methionine adenosyltransferase [Myxococcota bacterium]
MELVVDHLASPSPAEASVEVVERKGLGHPDTICDAVAEAASAALSDAYRDRFGTVLHHNVDKALLVGGASQPAFGGGRVIEPMELHLAGRAARGIGEATVPIDELVVEAARTWLACHLREVDVARHVRFQCHLRSGSRDLSSLFGRGDRVPLANDTSIGVGFAPESPLEGAVRGLDAHLRSEGMGREHPHLGEDLKIMAIRRGGTARFVVANAFIDRHVATLGDYRQRREALAEDVRRLASAWFDQVEVAVNAADDVEAGDVYLTVLGTSAEAGDDGEAGRGNRANGLITPMRSMTMESVAGKNPVSHVGKIYNVVADRIARSVWNDVPEVREATCLLVSRIGAPIDDPQLVDVRVHPAPGVDPEDVRGAVRTVVEREQGRMGEIDPDEVLARLTGSRR